MYYYSIKLGEDFFPYDFGSIVFLCQLLFVITSVEFQIKLLSTNFWQKGDDGGGCDNAQKIVRSGEPRCMCR